MSHKRLILRLMLVTAVFLLAACGGNEPEPTAPAAEPTVEIPPTFTPIPSPTPLTEPAFGLATVESVQILTLESFPVQINVRVRGVLPNDCTQIDEIIVQPEETHFAVAITTVQQPGSVCNEGEVPFEEMVPLAVEGLDAGAYTVSVNGIQGSFTLSEDNRLPDEASETGGSISVSGTVWHDLCTIPATADSEPSADCVANPDGSFQANGLLEDGEPGIGDIIVSLGAGDCPTAGPGLDTAVTDSNGRYTFTDVAPGDYCISIATLSEANQALLIPGSWTYPESGIPETAVTLAAGDSIDDINFGWDYQFLPLPEAGADCDNSFEFVRDLNIPDDTAFAPGAEFTKRWELRNNSACPWTSEYTIAFVSGDQMSALANVPLPQPVAPGQSVEIAIDMIAPNTVGDYRGNWQLADAAGEPFGINGIIEDAFWLQIQVREDAAPSATAEPNSAVIGGVVWDDFCNSANPGTGCAEFPEGSGNFIGNGSLNSGEARLSGVTMSLASGVCTSGAFPAAGTVITTTLTDADGLYRFENLPAGNYCVFMDALSPANVNLLIPGNWTWPAVGVGQLTAVMVDGEIALDIDFGWDYAE
ncbi:MAG: NBR1-Ig-like domain-containing protein [Chloroflexota bacterium]